MDENEVIMTKPEPDRGLLVKWLKILFYAHIASLVVSVVSGVSDLDTSWISWIITVAAAVCLFRLAPVNGRYRKAAVLSAVMIGCSVLNMVLQLGTVLTLAASVCSLIAVYQEYSAHSELVEQQDSKLSRQWHSLFNLQIIVGVLSGFVSVVVVLLVAMLELDTAGLPTIIVGALTVVQIILDAIYLIYINRTIRIFNAE